MDLKAIKYMILHMAAFHLYEVIFKCNVHLDDDSIVEAIGMSSIVMEVVVKGMAKRIQIMEVLHVPKL